MIYGEQVKGVKNASDEGYGLLAIVKVINNYDFSVSTNPDKEELFIDTLLKYLIKNCKLVDYDEEFTSYQYDKINTKAKKAAEESVKKLRIIENEKSNKVKESLLRKTYEF